MLYPIRFQPIFRRYLWGGRRLQSVLGKSIGSENDYAESWEIADHGGDQSVVINGSHAGKTLNALIRELGPRLLGETWNQRIGRDDVPLHLRGQFPLLLKFLDARLPLSVQVHPSDELAANRSPPDWGKSEAWYVMATGPQSRIYAGLHQGVDRRQLEAAIAAGAIESVVHSFRPQFGDSVFVPAGTVHAIGGDLLICEIQQASDTTYRLFDWNRVDASGKRRELHIAQGLDAVDFQRGPIEPLRPPIPAPPCPSNAVPLISCDKFFLSRWSIRQPQRIGGDGKMRIMVAVAGTGQMEYRQARESIVAGQSILIPAACDSAAILPSDQLTLLEIRFPE